MNLHTSFRYAALTAIVALAPLGALAQDEAEAPDGLSVTELQIGTALERGVVSEPLTSISRSAGRIYAVVRVQNPAREATNIRVAIERVGGSAARGFSLDIPARRRYRTVARFPSTRPAGQYRVVVRTEDGRELSSTELTITE